MMTLFQWSHCRFCSLYNRFVPFFLFMHKCLPTRVYTHCCVLFGILLFCKHCYNFEKYTSSLFYSLFVCERFYVGVQNHGHIVRNTYIKYIKSQSYFGNTCWKYTKSCSCFYKHWQSTSKIIVILLEKPAENIPNSNHIVRNTCRQNMKS